MFNSRGELNQINIDLFFQICLILIGAHKIHERWVVLPFFEGGENVRQNRVG
jgi:hypothetical protein